MQVAADQEDSAVSSSSRSSSTYVFTHVVSPDCPDNLEKKYFDYFVFNIVDYGVNCGLSRSGAHHRVLAQTIGNARGLDINSPRSAENHLKTCDFIDISNAMIPTTLGGSTTTSPPIVAAILRQQHAMSTPVRCVYFDYIHAIPDKS
jgi:hypothetical protein